MGNRLDYDHLQDAILDEVRNQKVARPTGELLEGLSARASFDDIEARRAIWSLIARNLIQLTDDWRLAHI